MELLVEDRYWGHSFGDREILIDDEFGRLDLEIFADAAQMDFPLDKYPECECPDIMELYTMNEAVKMAWDIFESNIKHILPYRVNFYGKGREIIEYTEKYTTCRVRVYPSYMLFEDRHDHALVYLKYKKPYEYKPTLYTVQLDKEKYDNDYNDDYIDIDNELVEWIEENLGELKWVCDHGYTIRHEYTFAFYSHEDAAMFKLRWE